MIFGLKKKKIIGHFNPYNVLLAIAKNIDTWFLDWFCGPWSHINKYIKCQSYNIFLRDFS